MFRANNSLVDRYFLFVLLISRLTSGASSSRSASGSFLFDWFAFTNNIAATPGRRVIGIAVRLVIGIVGISLSQTHVLVILMIELHNFHDARQIVATLILHAFVGGVICDVTALYRPSTVVLDGRRQIQVLNGATDRSCDRTGGRGELKKRVNKIKKNIQKQWN